MFYTYLKINSNYVQKVILLMISNKEKEDWYYLTAKKYQFCLLRETNV